MFTLLVCRGCKKWLRVFTGITTARCQDCGALSPVATNDPVPIVQPNDSTLSRLSDADRLLPIGTLSTESTAGPSPTAAVESASMGNEKNQSDSRELINESRQRESQRSERAGITSFTVFTCRGCKALIKVRDGTQLPKCPACGSGYLVPKKTTTAAVTQQLDSRGDSDHKENCQYAGNDCSPYERELARLTIPTGPFKGVNVDQLLMGQWRRVSKLRVAPAPELPLDESMPGLPYYADMVTGEGAEWWQHMYPDFFSRLWRHYETNSDVKQAVDNFFEDGDRRSPQDLKRTISRWLRDS